MTVGAARPPPLGHRLLHEQVGLDKETIRKHVREQEERQTARRSVSAERLTGSPEGAFLRRDKTPPLGGKRKPRAMPVDPYLLPWQLFSIS